MAPERQKAAKSKAGLRGVAEKKCLYEDSRGFRRYVCLAASAAESYALWQQQTPDPVNNVFCMRVIPDAPEEQAVLSSREETANKALSLRTANTNATIEGPRNIKSRSGFIVNKAGERRVRPAFRTRRFAAAFMLSTCGIAIVLLGGCTHA